MPFSVSADIGSQLHEVGAAGIVSEQKDALPKPLKHRRNPGYCRRRPAAITKSFLARARSGLPSTGATFLDQGAPLFGRCNGASCLGAERQPKKLR